MNIDESGINENMVKVNFSCSEATINEDGDEVSDIVIKINEKDSLEDNGQREVIEDIPVTYDQNTGETQNPVVMPENVPQSVNVNELQDLRYFNIDGFWYSTDHRYVYRIDTTDQSVLATHIRFVDLKGEAEGKNGKLKQTSSYSVILNATEDGEFSPEVFAEGNRLVSDEIILERVDDSVVSNLIGTWSNGDTTYTFDTDGKYRVKESDDSYWGEYFVVSGTEVVLGKARKDMKMQSYKIEGETLTINEILSLERQ